MCKKQHNVILQECCHRHVFPTSLGCSTLTCYRKDDHNKIKDIPANCEEVLSKCNHLKYAFPWEDDDEHQIDQVQDILFLSTLVICLYHHGHHIEADKHHDKDVKELFWDEVKHHALDTILLEKQYSRFVFKNFLKRFNADIKIKHFVDSQLVLMVKNKQWKIECK